MADIDTTNVTLAKCFATLINYIPYESDGFKDQDWVDEYVHLMNCVGAQLDSPEAHSRGAVDPNRYWIFEDGSKLDLSNPRQECFCAHATATRPQEGDVDLFYSLTEDNKR